MIKAGNLSSHPEEASRLRAAARQAGAIILDQTLPRGELNGLIQACDCYVSLHRSEGFGLTMAEAMLLGKPVIATGYSGNLEFMDRGNSLLIGHEARPGRASDRPVLEGLALGGTLGCRGRRGNALDP